VEEIVCLHAWSLLKAGEVGVWPGQYMAACDEFRIRVVGKGGHGAGPSRARNPIVPASAIVVALQDIVSSEVPAFAPAVITVCAVHAGQAFNVIPGEAALRGTARSMHPKVRDRLEERVRLVAGGVAQAFGCKAEVEYLRGTPPLVNDPGVSASLLAAMEQAVGKGAVRDLDGPGMGSEDFAYYLERVPRGALFRLGIANPETGRGPAGHTPTFDFNDDAIPTGIAVMAQYIYNRHGA